MPTKDIFAVTPFYPDETDNEINNSILLLKGEVGKLSAATHPLTAKSLAELVVTMNSYYSNLIEGHFTHPLDVEKATKKDYSTDKEKKLLQLESVAHIEVNKAMRQRLKEENINVSSSDFLCWLHHSFYEHLPKKMRSIKSNINEVWEVIPGEIRVRDVEVGRHIAPSHESLQSFLTAFDENYSPRHIKSNAKRILAAAASHHRLAWIHPFLDGNG